MTERTVEPLLDTDVLNDVIKQRLLLLYPGKNGCTFVKSLKTHLQNVLPLNVKADLVT